MDLVLLSFQEKHILFPSSNTTLYAIYTAENTFSVIYNSNGSTSGSTPNSQTGIINSIITISNNSGNLNKTGYTFLGWNTLSNGLGISYSPGSQFIIPDSDTILYAIYINSINNRFTVSYNGNSQTSGSSPTSQTGTTGQIISISSNSGNLFKTGYTFSGWNTTSDGTGNNYGVGSNFTIGLSNTTLYALYAENGKTGATGPRGESSNQIINKKYEINPDYQTFFKNLYNKLYKQLYNQLYKQLYNQSYDQLYNQLYTQLITYGDTLIQGSVGAQGLKGESGECSDCNSEGLEYPTYDVLYSDLYDNLYNELYNNLYDPMYNQLYNQLYDQLYENIKKNNIILKKSAGTLIQGLTGEPGPQGEKGECICQDSKISSRITDFYSYSNIYKNFYDKLYDQLYNQLYDQHYNQTYNQLYNQLFEQLYNSL
jgi:hypothetical protein